METRPDDAPLRSVKEAGASSVHSPTPTTPKTSSDSRGCVLVLAALALVAFLVFALMFGSKHEEPANWVDMLSGGAMALSILTIIIVWKSLRRNPPSGSRAESKGGVGGESDVGTEILAAIVRENLGVKIDEDLMWARIDRLEASGGKGRLDPKTAGCISRWESEHPRPSRKDDQHEHSEMLSAGDVVKAGLAVGIAGAVYEEHKRSQESRERQRVEEESRKQKRKDWEAEVKRMRRCPGCGQEYSRVVQTDGRHEERACMNQRCKHRWTVNLLPKN